MIREYCKLVHGRKTLCPDCSRLEEYALKHIDNCTFGEDKPVCKDCPVHCYKPFMREQIRQVMRISGPRMLLRHPILTVSHLIREKRGYRMRDARYLASRILHHLFLNSNF